MLNLLGASWVVSSRVISRITTVITYVSGLITLLIAIHEPPSTLVWGLVGPPTAASRGRLQRPACGDG